MTGGGEMMSCLAECLQRDEAWIQAILAASPDGAVLINDRGKITHANSVLEEMFGWSSVELNGQPIELLVPERFCHDHEEAADATT